MKRNKSVWSGQVNRSEIRNYLVRVWIALTKGGSLKDWVISRVFTIEVRSCMILYEADPLIGLTEVKNRKIHFYN